MRGSGRLPSRRSKGPRGFRAFVRSRLTFPLWQGLDSPIMMKRLRMFLACLLLVAIPLQGMAAAAMLFCGPAGSSDRSAMTGAHGPKHGSGLASDEHAQHVHQHVGHGHASSDVHADIDVSANADSDGAEPAGSTAGTAGHTCSACAACCHGAAVTATVQVPTVSPAPQTVLAEPLVLVQNRPSPVPDKPPRA